MESSGDNSGPSSDRYLVDIEAKIKNHIKSLKTRRDESHQSSSSLIGKSSSSVTPMDIFFFNQRVKSFQITTWFNKPFVVNPLQCARYGFINVAADKIECSQCHNRKCLKSTFDNIKISSEVLEHRALEFCEELKSSHTHQCVFYNQPSPLRFTLFSHQDTSSGKDLTIAKIHCFEFYNLMKKYRKINKTLPVDIHLDQTFVNEYFSKHSLLINRILDQMHVEERELYTTFCWLSIFNWQISIKSEDKNYELPNLTCQHCQMTHYLKIKNNCITSGENLHPHSMHRWWCPCVHVNKLLVDYEQIIENEDQSYLKSLTKRQLNEESGWKQMIDSISIGLSSESELTHLHKDSLENELNAATLVKNILSNSISSIFECEKKRKDNLKIMFDKIYYNNEMQIVDNEQKGAIIDSIANMKTIAPVEIAIDKSPIIPSHTTPLSETKLKEVNTNTTQMDLSDDEIEIENSEIIIETLEETPTIHTIPKHALHQTTLDSYFSTPSDLKENEEPTLEEVTEQQEPQMSEYQPEDENTTTEIIPQNIDTKCLEEPEPSEERATTTPSTPESVPVEPELTPIESPATRKELTTPVSATFSETEFEETTPRKFTSTTAQTPKTPSELNLVSPLTGTSDASPSIIKSSLTSSESKQDNKVEINKTRTQPKPQTPSQSKSEDRPKPKPVSSTPSPHKTTSKEEQSSSSSYKPTYKSRDASSSSRNKPTQPPPRKRVQENNPPPSDSSKKAPQNDRRLEQVNKRKKPSSYQSGNPKTKKR